MKLKQFKLSGLTIKIATAPSGRNGDFIYTEDSNWDDFMGELLLTAIKKLVDEKDDFLLEFFVEHFGINNFDDILNIDISEIFKKIEKPYIYSVNNDGDCIGWDYDEITDVFDDFCREGKFDEQYLKYSVDESYAGVTIGHLKIVE